MFGVHKSPAEQFKLIIVSLWNMGDIGHDSSFPRISSNIPYWPFQFIQPHIHVHNQINNAMLCAHLTLILYIYRSLSITLTRSRRSMRPMRHVHCLQLKCISEQTRERERDWGCERASDRVTCCCGAANCTAKLLWDRTVSKNGEIEFSSYNI